PERTLILGWNRRATIVIQQLDLYVAPDSEVMVVAELPEVGDIIADLRGSLRNLQVHFRYGSTSSRQVLDSLNAHTFHHIITLSYMDILGIQEADARTLITLLHLRDIAEGTGSRFSIVSEMLDVRNRELAEVTRADDFIVSDKLISLMLSQLSENPDLMAVLSELFNPQGAELYLKPAGDYVGLGQHMNFYTVVEAARRRGEIAIGYRLAAQANDVTAAYGVYVNPNKTEVLAFAPDDRIIVLADE
ncbi:MAG: potassium transporter TrkA, partial [Chloroflexi bacterium]|nr:potassium transporter TrkA [Chloroflexota bacterium]